MSDPYDMIGFYTPKDLMIPSGPRYIISRIAPENIFDTEDHMTIAKVYDSNVRDKIIELLNKGV